MKTLVTGAAGFIGYHIAERLLREGQEVLGIDTLTPYYDPRLKRARLANLERRANFDFARVDIADRRSMDTLFARHEFSAVIHLAAQPGVRASLGGPQAYIDANVTGFLNVLEECRKQRIRHLIYASSSSVYGDNSKTSFSIADRVDSPLSLYAVTKRTNELMAHCYAHQFGLAMTGLRFFTVYGPWGRPDMAPFRFARAIDQGEPIDLYNYGRMTRDFTYIDDIVEGILCVLGGDPEGNRVLNLGGGAPVSLMTFVQALEQELGRKARKRFLPMQPCDMVATCADMRESAPFTGFRRPTPLDTGVAKFVDWYRGYTGSQRPISVAAAG